MKRIVFLALGFLLVACGNPLAAAPTPSPTPTCQQQAAPFLAEMQSIAREWDDANALAGQTPRSALAQQIESLQTVRRKAEDVQAPDCAAAVKTALVGSMEATIQGFIAFLGQSPDTEVSAAFTVATDKMKAFNDALMVVNGIPLPTPTPAPTPTIALPTRDVVAAPVLMEQHHRIVLYAAPHGALQRTLGNPGTIVFLAKNGDEDDVWYRVQIGNETGWIARVDLNRDLDEEIRRVLPIETP